nr:Stl1.2 [Starmerella bombicola]
MPPMADVPQSGLIGKKLLYFVSLFVSLGVFLFGYDQGVMSGVITGKHFRTYFDEPSPARIGTMVAILEVGAFVSSLLVGRLGDMWGRRRTILYGAIIFTIGGALQTAAYAFWIMIIGRIISGFGVGMLSTIVPVYQSEISPPHNRGKLACIEFTGNIIGYAASVWVDYGFSFIDSDLSWRMPLFIQCVIGIFLAVGSKFIVETPRWLLNRDKDEEGLKTLLRLYPNQSQAQAQYDEIKETVMLHRMEGKHSYLYMWRRYKKRVLIAMASQAFAQLNGINVISYYAPLVFQQAGWKGRSALLMTGINGLVYVASTIPPWYLVDRWGRRRILMSGGLVMAFALIMISYFIFLQLSISPALVVAFVMIYNAFFGYSWGPIPWLYPPEILPLSIRAKGASLSTAANWAFNFLVGEVVPILQHKMGWSMYLLPAFFSICSVILVYYIFPETKGVTLEEMDSVFGDRTLRSTVSMIDREALLDDADYHPSRPSAASVAR